MAVEQEHFVHLARPLAPSVLGYGASSAPLAVNIQPQVRAIPKSNPPPPTYTLDSLVLLFTCSMLYHYAMGSERGWRLSLSLSRLVASKPNSL